MTRSNHQRRIDRFMTLAGQDVPKYLTMPSEEIRRLRAKLILEEAMETIDALGFSIHVTAESDYTIDSGFILKSDTEPNMVEIADGCADISVVTTGTLSACGIDNIELLEEVDQSNLRKFGPGGHKRDDGKWIKPDDWTPPEIQRVLNLFKRS